MHRVLIVTDVRLYREGLTRVLDREPELCIIGAAPDLAAALQCMSAAPPDVVLIDEANLERSALVRGIRLTAPEVKVVVLAARDAADTVAWRGVWGQVSREAGVEELIATIQGPPQIKRRWLPRGVGRHERHGERSTRLAADGLGGQVKGLTGRELEILSLLERGFTNKAIASDLGIEIATVKNHVHNILEKLRVRRRGQAAAWIRGLPRRLLGM